MSSADLLASSAVSLVAHLRAGEITLHECLDALESRIAVVDPVVNALPTLCFDRAHAAADALMMKQPAERGLLAGLPIPIKDLTAVAGVRTTQGSPIFADTVPTASDVVVTRIEAEGGIIYAKSNTPEFGAGANTFNEVFGPTLNPHDTSKSAAGSSGGAAVALATGMAWLAHGSDMGGSLRNPASFCGVVGMRPSPGRVAQSRISSVDDTLSTHGPMARTVEDCALFLDALCGDHPRDPLSKPRPAQSFLAASRSDWTPRRVAYSPDLGITPVEPEVVALTRRVADRLAAEGVVVEEVHPDFSGAHETFQTLRAEDFALSIGPLMETHRDRLKPEVIWNVEKGLALTAEQILRATRERAAIMNRAATFFETYDLLICPAAITAPFPIGERYLSSCNGVAFETYIDWLAIVFAGTLACLPALSLPCGVTAAGLPVGLQVLAATNADARVLAGAAYIESLLGLDTKPIDPKPPRS